MEKSLFYSVFFYFVPTAFFLIHFHGSQETKRPHFFGVHFCETDATKLTCFHKLPEGSRRRGRAAGLGTDAVT